MPRAQTSPAGRISEFFRTAPMEVAEFAFGQVRDVLNERRAKSKAAKDRAAGGKKPQAAAAPATARVAKPATKKKSHKKKKPQTPAVAATTTADPSLPLQDTYAEGAGDAGDAADLVGAGTTQS